VNLKPHPLAGLLLVLEEWRRKGDMTLNEVINDMIQRTVCIDLDGVLAEFDGWKGEDVLGEPYEHTRRFLEAVVALGYDVVVHTVRKTNRVWKWIYDHDFNDLIVGVTSIKPPAFAYIDDRAICFEGDHDATLWALRKFKAHWEKP
jgi:adenylylsulfate kinase